MAKALDYIMGTANLIGGDNTGTGGTGKSTTVSPAATPVAGETNNEAGKNTTNTQQSGNVAQPSTQTVTDTTSAQDGTETDNVRNLGKKLVTQKNLEEAGLLDENGMTFPDENGLYTEDQIQYIEDKDDEKDIPLRPASTWEKKQTSVSPTTTSPLFDSSMWEDDEETKEWQAKQDAARMDILKALDEEARSIKPAETEDERKKREKKERMSKVFAAIGDGIASLSNLYFTTKGAPNAYTGQDTLSAKNQERIERLKKEREGDRDRWLKIQTSRYGMIDDAIKQRRTAKKERLMLMMQAQKAGQEAEVLRQRAEVYRQQGNLYAAQQADKDADVKLKEQQALKAKAEARRANEQADMVKPLAQSTMAKNAAQAGAADASRVNSLESAAEHRAKANNERSGKGSSSRYHGTYNGVAYETAADYTQAVYDDALANGVSIEDVMGNKIDASVLAGTMNARRKAGKLNETASNLRSKLPGGSAKPKKKGNYANKNYR